MSKRLVLVLLVLALVAAAGTVPKLATYNLTLSRDVTMSGTILKAGDYKLVVGDAKVTLISKDKNTSVESPVKVETVASKFDSTSVTFQTAGTNNVISEIDLGGSKTKVVFAK